MATMSTKVSEEQCARLRQLKNDQAVHQAKANAAGAQLQLEVVELLTAEGVPVETGAVCLDCGTVRRDARKPCQCEHTKR